MLIALKDLLFTFSTFGFFLSFEMVKNWLIDIKLLKVVKLKVSNSFFSSKETFSISLSNTGPGLSDQFC